ncbi:alpha/beta fold hydrolase [Macrococcus carouselicus]|uniref:Alpha/beta hydrolase n=1 Tax=Macrococcus carouselicus TaxID=69969 RepID=A0A9Q8CMF7_9STAP|nr:alpha/beta hydrolase [Macrococcus carouselicus]TDM04676.1 alpha/beta hydrolase [Macrococcus carouselicus]
MKINIKNVSINYKEVGSDQPVYFIHGNALELNSHYKLYDDLFDDSAYRRIYFDLPGMGESEVDYSVATTNDMLDIIMAFINTLTPKQDLILVGHSYGAYMCLGLMDRWKNRITDAFLTCPVVEGQFAERTREKLSPRMLEAVKVDADADYYDEYTDTTAVISHETWQRYRELIVPGVKLADRQFMKMLRRAESLYYQFRCEEVIDVGDKTRLQVVLSKEDNVVGYKDQLAFFGPLPNATVTVLAGAGHNPMIEEYDSVRSLAALFIERL